jgi:hypothetical protein
MARRKRMHRRIVKGSGVRHASVKAPVRVAMQRATRSAASKARATMPAFKVKGS